MSTRLKCLEIKRNENKKTALRLLTASLVFDNKLIDYIYFVLNLERTLRVDKHRTLLCLLGFAVWRTGTVWWRCQSSMLAGWSMLLKSLLSSYSQTSDSPVEISFATLSTATPSLELRDTNILLNRERKIIIVSRRRSPQKMKTPINMYVKYNTRVSSHTYINTHSYIRLLD